MATISRNRMTIPRNNKYFYVIAKYYQFSAYFKTMAAARIHKKRITSLLVTCMTASRQHKRSTVLNGYSDNG